jgi:hypothetical protein
MFRGGGFTQILAQVRIRRPARSVGSKPALTMTA